jgi:hypothetical protein
MYCNEPESSDTGQELLLAAGEDNSAAIYLKRNGPPQPLEIRRFLAFFVEDFACPAYEYFSLSILAS